jgi:hypothetical protein
LSKERKEGEWLPNKLAKANASSLNLVHACLVNSELRPETRMARTSVPDASGKILDVENDLEMSIKEILLKEMRHCRCYYELTFPLDDAKNGNQKEFFSRSRSPDFVIPQIRVDNKFLDLDPHHFSIDEKGYAVRKHVEKWAEFKRTWGDNLYIVFISHNTEKEVEKQTGMCVDALCDQFLHVGRRGNLQNEELNSQNKMMIKGMMGGLMGKSKRQGGYANSHSEAALKEFQELMKRVERGRVVQRYLNATRRLSDDAAITILRALKG